MGSFSEVCSSVTIGAMMVNPIDHLVEIDGMRIYRLKKNKNIDAQETIDGLENEQFNLTLLLETEEEWVYLLSSIDREQITMAELQLIINRLRDDLKTHWKSQNDFQSWFRERLLNDFMEPSETFPQWVKEVYPWDRGWFPLLLIKKVQGWEDKFLLDMIHSYIDTQVESIKISENVLLFLVSNEEFQFHTAYVHEITEFAFGLHDMLQTEWNEEIKIGIDQPVYQLGELLYRSRQLLKDREWVNWMWENVGVFSPWNHFLERLISLIPPKFLGDLQNQQWLLDPEIEETIQVFFAENLNMSETARHLFIHRNTLQYRIDKVKQATGLDVKHLEDAILYKVLSLVNKRIEKSVQKTE